MRVLQRLLLYIVVCAVLVLVAFWLGVEHFERVNCSGSGFEGECDLAALEGLVWSAIALALAGMGSVLVEVSLALKRRSAQGANEGGQAGW
jgi:hypothetical protein